MAPESWRLGGCRAEKTGNYATIDTFGELTEMATLDDLALPGGPLVRYEPRRRPKAFADTRKLYLVKAMHQHLETGMDHLLGDRSILTTPKAAVIRCFNTFCANEPFARATSEHNGFRVLEGGDGVCELKTFDVRAIGFFWRQKSYVVTNIELRRDLKVFKDYDPFIQSAHCHMDALGLDPPPCITGDKYHDLF